MLITENVEIEITKSNISIYKRLYHDFDIKIGIIIIPIEKLSKGSSIMIDFMCDNCGDIIKMKYILYLKNINKKYCRKCNNRNHMLEKYNIDKNDIDKNVEIKIQNKKRCRLCGEYKEYEKFNKMNTSKDGLRTYCNECRKSITLEYRKRNSKVLSEKQMLYDKKNIHNRIWKDLLRYSLKRIGKKKEGHTIDLLGYSAIELKIHIESLFTTGMSWENRSEWHIDHIKPMCEFDYNTSISEVCALSNLQPLWATTREIDGIIYKGNLNKVSNY
jgi:hypothetical protein